MSDIEEDVKTINHIISFYKDLDIINNKDKCNEIQALENILSERERDKKKIKELEQENRIQRRQLNSAFDRGWIPKEKVKELIKNETIDISGFKCIAVEDIEKLSKEYNK